jgi:NADPH-ferrihemoprotein reductase
LQDVQFAIFGMGNSKYTFYNQFAKTVNTLLLSFGASPLIDITLADAANDLIDEDFYSWTEKISQTLANKLGAECKQQEYQPALTIQFGENTLDKDTNQIAVPHHALIYNTQKSKYAIYELPIKATRLLACANGKYYLHAEIDLSQNLRLKYNTGDHIDIWSENSDAAIKALQKALGISSAVMTAAFICVPRNPEVATHQKLNGQYTLDALFRRYLDIAAPVSREFILDLVQFAESPSAKRGLAIIGKSKEAYTQLRASQNICLARILNMFGPYSVWNIPIPFILERMQFISPRTYSISSASTVSPRQVSITVSTKQIELKNDKEVIHGLASHYLLDIHRAMSTCRPTIVCQVRKSTFKPPFSLLQPMIMIAAGTGIAPFRAFIQQRVRQAELGKEVGSMVLFFGCRSQDDDLYADEHAHAKQVLKERFTLVVAHSSPASGKVYVQDRLQQHDQNFGSLILDEDASLYVCGSTSLATGVRVTVRRIICERQGWSEAEYLEFESRQKRSKRWQEDLFG